MTNAQGSFAANTSTGNQTVDTATGVEMKALILFGTNQTAEGFAAGQSGFIGFAASSTQRGVNAWAGDDNVASTNWGKGISNALVVRLFSNGTPTVDAEADFVSFGTGADAGKFTINWTNAPATAVIVHYIALGGADITNVFVGQKTAKITSTGNKAETGVGFQGDLLLFSGANIATNINTTALGGFFGAAQSTTKRGAIWWGGRDARTAAGNSKHWQSTVKAIVIPNANGTGIDAEADFVSFDTDGYTLNWTDFAASAWLYNVMVIKGGQYDVGNFTSPASTGVQSYTTGFQPKQVLFFGTGQSTANSTLGLEAHMTIGAMGPSLVEDSIWTSADDVIPTDDNSRTVTTKVLSANTNPSTIVAEADANAFGATSFSLDWTTTASGRVFFYVAIGDSAPASVVIDANGTISYGILDQGATRDTTPSGMNTTIRARNDGGVTETLNIRGKNSANWTLATTQGANQYFHKFSTDGGTVWNTITSDTWTTMYTGVEASATRDFDLQIGMPTSDSSGGATQDVSITIQAVQ